MKFVVWVIAAAFLLPVLCLAGDDAAKDAKEEIVKRIAAMDAATKKGDRKTVEGTYDDEGVFVNERGQALSKSSYIAEFMNETVRYESVKSAQSSLRIFGDAAAETGIWEATGMENGKPFHWKVQFTSLWIKKKGVWIITAEHNTDLMTAK